MADDDDDYDNIDSDDRYSYFRIDYVYDYNLTTMIILCVIIMTQIMSNFFLNNKKDYKLTTTTTITIITNYICLLTVTVRKIICQLSNATHEISFSSQELLSTKRKHWKKMKMMMVSTEGSQGVESITKIRKFALSSVLTLNPSLPLEEAPSFLILCSF